MSQNGQIPQKDLHRIFTGNGRVLYLVEEPAAALNTMALDCLTRKDLATPEYRAAYRAIGHEGDWPNVLDTQWYYYVLMHHGGNLAAFPGTSNHGNGTTVDAQLPGTRHIIDEIGEQYGWAKKWSDAPTEAWHVMYKYHVWEPRPDPGIDRMYPRLANGSGGPGQKPHVQKLQGRLNIWLPDADLKRDGSFGPGTAEAIADFCRKVDLKPTRETNKQVWKVLDVDPKKWEELHT